MQITKCCYFYYSVKYKSNNFNGYFSGLSMFTVWPEKISETLLGDCWSGNIHQGYPSWYPAYIVEAFKQFWPNKFTKVANDCTVQHMTPHNNISTIYLCYIYYLCILYLCCYNSYLYDCIPWKSAIQLGFKVLPLYSARCPSNVNNKMSWTPSALTSTQTGGTITPAFVLLQYDNNKKCQTTERLPKHEMKRKNIMLINNC